MGFQPKPVQRASGPLDSHYDIKKETHLHLQVRFRRDILQNPSIEDTDLSATEVYYETLSGIH
jgi:hypothetical protein